MVCWYRKGAQPGLAFAHVAIVRCQVVDVQDWGGPQEDRGGGVVGCEAREGVVEGFVGMLQIWSH